MITYTHHAAISLQVNGEAREVVVRPADTLLHVLRHTLGLTGTKVGCENGDCGACTVLLDGKPVKSCMVLTVEAEGFEITTIEGLSGTASSRRFWTRRDTNAASARPASSSMPMPCLRRIPAPIPRRSAPGWTATSAAAPATKGSKGRLQRRRRRRNNSGDYSRSSSNVWCK